MRSKRGGAEWHFSFRVQHHWMGIRGITHKMQMDSTGDKWEGSVGTSMLKSTPLDGHQGWFELGGVVSQAAAQHHVVVKEWRACG